MTYVYNELTGGASNGEEQAKGEGIARLHAGCGKIQRCIRCECCNLRGLNSGELGKKVPHRSKGKLAQTRSFHDNQTKATPQEAEDGEELQVNEEF